MVHVRTKDSFARLDAKEIDLLCGGFASVAGTDDMPGDYEFLQWRREGLVLLTTCPDASCLSRRSAWSGCPTCR